MCSNVRRVCAEITNVVKRTTGCYVSNIIQRDSYDFFFTAYNSSYTTAARQPADVTETLDFDRYDTPK